MKILLSQIFRLLCIILFLIPSVHAGDQTCSIPFESLQTGGFCIGERCGEEAVHPSGALFLYKNGTARLRTYGDDWQNLKWKYDSGEITVSGKIKTRVRCSYCEDAPVFLKNCKFEIPRGLQSYLCDRNALIKNGCKVSEDGSEGTSSPKCVAYCRDQCKKAMLEQYGLTDSVEFEVLITLLPNSDHGVATQAYSFQTNYKKGKIPTDWYFNHHTRKWPCPETIKH